MKLSEARVGMAGKFKGYATYQIRSIHTHPEALTLHNGNGSMICRPEEFESMEAFYEREKSEAKARWLEVEKFYDPAILVKDAAKAAGIHWNVMYARIREAEKYGFIPSPKNPA